VKRILSASQILQSTVYVVLAELFVAATAAPWLLFGVYFIDVKFGFSVQAGTHLHND